MSIAFMSFLLIFFVFIIYRIFFGLALVDIALVELNISYH